jgi:CheY-like chemotaxis protein
MPIKRLLLVDDHDDSLAVLTVVLRERYALLSCNSSEKALASLENFKPDLLVLDIVMSSMDGIRCLQAIRSVPEFCRIPAIALTALARDIDKDSLFAAGFQAVMTKPILDYLDLEGTIDTVLELHPVRYASAPKTEIGGSE